MIPVGALSSLGKFLPLDTVDNKGVVWWIGTQKGAASFSNPHTAGWVVASWIGNGSGVPADTVDRNTLGANVHTSSTTNSWWKIDLGATRKLTATHMRCMNRSSYNDQVPTNASVLGSNNNTDWTTLGGVTTGQWLGNANVWNTISLNANLGAYRYFMYRFDTMNASNAWYICIQEYELFGTLVE